MTGKYDDMLHLPYPFPGKRPGMSMTDRGAQFSPFAALTGYDAALVETGRQTEIKAELTEDTRYDLDRKQRLLAEAILSCPDVSITYFVPDRRKSGGQYVTVMGRLRNIDIHDRLYVLQDGSKIPMDDIRMLDSSLFQNLYL